VRWLLSPSNHLARLALLPVSADHEPAAPAPTPRSPTNTDAPAWMRRLIFVEAPLPLLLADPADFASPGALVDKSVDGRVDLIPQEVRGLSVCCGDSIGA
jgi:hypothetical protein